jgi:hypothetical protein
MPTTLELPGRLAPSNLHLPQDAQHMAVEADLYNICERVKEISDRLHIILLTHDDKHSFAIMEHCDDGVERLVFKVADLDARVLKRLRELMAQPLAERVAAIERDQRRFVEQEQEREFEELYERLGGPMWSELERCGFIQRPVSYPKAGVATRGKKRR